MTEKILLITTGGHIASFHAAMMGMYKFLDEKAKGKFELLGAKGGIRGLIKEEFIPIHVKDIEICRAGSLIGADRRKIENSEIEKIVHSVGSCNNRGIYAVVMMGGDNHLSEAAKLKEAGVNIVGYPKTMDGDLSSFISLGWETAVTVAARQTQFHHNTALTNRRVFYVGLFGRNTDWTLCGVTAYGGGDIGIPCEQSYSWDFVWEKINTSLMLNRDKYGIEFAVVPYSEGSKINEVMDLPKEHQSKDAHELPKLQPEWIGLELVRLTKKMGKNAAFQTHTYDMRDSPPTETDKRLSWMAGEECMRMILENDFGNCAVFEPDGYGFYKTSRALLQDVSVQRMLKPTGFFDYDLLKPNKSFVNFYSDLFRGSLSKPPCKDKLVYQNMVRYH